MITIMVLGTDPMLDWWCKTNDYYDDVCMIYAEKNVKK